MILTIILAFLLAISAVSAADNVTSDVVGVEEITAAVSVDEADEVVSAEENQVIGSTGDVGNFKEIADLISKAEESGTLILDKDFKKEDDESALTISKPMTIDGRGHSLTSLSCIANVDASNVIFKNITFTETSNHYGGVVLCRGDNITMENCRFIDCFSRYDGAIYATGNNGNIINTTFTFSYSITPFDYGIGYSSAVTGSGNNWNIINCRFTNCSYFAGGAISAEGNNWKIINSSFMNCKAHWDGGAVYAGGSSWSIINSSFRKCIAQTGGAVYITGKNSMILNTIFTSNRAEKNADWYSAYPVITTVTASDLKTTYTANPYYVIKVYDTNGKPVDNTAVVVKLNGKTFKTIKTTKGTAKFKVNQKPGTYKLTITALKNTATKTLTVKHAVTLKAVTVKKSAKKLTLQANLAKINGKYLTKKTVTFKFNGKTYKAKTNSKGVAKATIKKSVLSKLKVGKKVTYQATYLKDTVKKTAKVKK